MEEMQPIFIIPQQEGAKPFVPSILVRPTTTTITTAAAAASKGNRFRPPQAHPLYCCYHPLRRNFLQPPAALRCRACYGRPGVGGDQYYRELSRTAPTILADLKKNVPPIQPRPSRIPLKRTRAHANLLPLMQNTTLQALPKRRGDNADPMVGEIEIEIDPLEHQTQRDPLITQSS